MNKIKDIVEFLTKFDSFKAWLKNVLIDLTVYLVPIEINLIGKSLYVK